MPIGVGTALGIGAATSLASGALQAGAASSAAGDQEQADKYAADLQQQQYEQTRSDLLPYNQLGEGANQAISAMAPFNFAPTQANLENTPGYQFSLYQGMRGVNNAAAARGLGVSGAALKGGATFAQGLASNTYQQQFQNALNTYGTNLGKLQTQASLGEDAAARTGNIGATLAGNAGQALVAGGNAAASGQVGVANALSGGAANASNALVANALFGANGMYGNTAGAGAPAYGSPGWSFTTGETDLGPG